MLLLLPFRHLRNVAEQLVKKNRKESELDTLCLGDLMHLPLLRTADVIRRSADDGAQMAGGEGRARFPLWRRFRSVTLGLCLGGARQISAPPTSRRVSCRDRSCLVK